ncbi:MAG: hypothetical protein GY720_13655, partial [bacterium]|nr:hypothetical protein [bacterium]
MDLPRSGLVRGVVLIPSQHDGVPNAGNAYFSVQLRGGKGGPHVSLSGHRATGICKVTRQLDGEPASPIELAGVLCDDVWIPWQVAWEWDGRSAQGLCRVAVFDKETDPLPFDMEPLDLLRVVSGWSNAVNSNVLVTDITVESAPEALQSAFGGEVLRRPPFAVAVCKTILSDTFDTADPEDTESPRGWYNWKPDSCSGRFIYDREYGRRDNCSVCLAGTRTGVWQNKVPARPGVMYRFSAWVKVEQVEPNATITLSMQPRGISKVTGKESWMNARGVPNRVVVEPGYWQYLETFWTAPASGEYAEGKLTLIDVEFICKALQGKAWCDDARLEEVEVTAPWREDFENAAAAHDNWRIYAFQGLEGQAEVVHEANGFGNPGALSLTHLRGQVGFSAAHILQRETFGPLRNWVLLVHAKGSDEGVPAVNVQQLDDKGEMLTTTGEEPDAVSDPGWREHRLSFCLHPRASQVRLLLTNNGPGRALFDSVWLRPAQADELAGAQKEALPVMFRVFPTDVIAAIDQTPAIFTIPSGQAGAFNLHLYGDRESKAETRVEIEAPDWLVLRTTQMACYGKEPLEFAKTPAKAAGRRVFTLTDPYPWQQWQRGDEPNPYTGLLCVWRADAEPGAED